MSSLPTLALKSSNKIVILFRAFIGNDMTPAPLSVMYEILSVTISTLLTAVIFSYVQNLYPINGSHSPSHRRISILLLVQCHCLPV
jgi:hypothetical protein